VFESIRHVNIAMFVTLRGGWSNNRIIRY